MDFDHGTDQNISSPKTNKKLTIPPILSVKAIPDSDPKPLKAPNSPNKPIKGATLSKQASMPVMKKIQRVNLFYSDEAKESYMPQGG